MIWWQALLMAASFLQDSCCQRISSLLLGYSAFPACGIFNTRSDLHFEELIILGKRESEDWRKLVYISLFHSLSFLSFLFFPQKATLPLTNPKAIKLKQDSSVQRVIWDNPLISISVSAGHSSDISKDCDPNENHTSSQN